MERPKTYLHVIIDDCSRYIVHGRFYLTESVEPLIYDLMGGVKRFGIPQRFYVANGAAYVSGHLKIICARNGIDLVHTPPYRPQGRGKVELAHYHETIHSSLECSPLQKWLQTRNCCRVLPPSIDINSLFKMERRCRVYKDSTNRFLKTALSLIGTGKSFTLSGPSGAGKSTLVHYVLSRLDGNCYRPAPVHYGGLQRNGILKAIVDVVIRDLLLPQNQVLKIPRI